MKPFPWRNGVRSRRSARNNLADDAVLPAPLMSTGGIGFDHIRKDTDGCCLARGLLARR
jgi:hypothetical protein